MAQEQLLPHDLNAEEALLGTALLDSQVVASLAGKLRPADFYRLANQLIWEACLDIHRQQGPVDQLTVARRLADKAQLDTIGGMACLSNYIAGTPTVLHAEYYANLVLEMRRRRDAIGLGSSMVGQLYDGAGVDPVISQTINQLLQLQVEDDRHPASMQELYSLYQAELCEQVIRQDSLSLGARPTGYAGLNALINGWEDGLFYVLGARTSMGKTMVALNLALRMAEQGYSVFFFSLELSKKAVYRRLAFAAAQLDFYALRIAKDDALDQGLEQLQKSLNQIQDYRIWVQDRRGLRPVDIRATLTEHQQLHGKPDLVIVDYLNLVEPEQGSRSRYESLTEVVRQLKNIGGHLDLPLLVAAQLNRGPENRPEQSRRPTLADFRDTGAIEEVASVVMALYRPAYYYRTPAEWEREFPGKPYPATDLEMIILKNQEGPVGKKTFQADVKSGFLREGLGEGS